MVYFLGGSIRKDGGPRGLSIRTLTNQINLKQSGGLASRLQSNTPSRDFSKNLDRGTLKDALLGNSGKKAYNRGSKI